MSVVKDMFLDVFFCLKFDLRILIIWEIKFCKENKYFMEYVMLNLR